MAAWYVAYRKGDSVNEMHIASDRARAIAIALDMLDQHLDVTEVGPMFDFEPKIPREEIRAMWREERSTAARPF